MLQRPVPWAQAVSSPDNLFHLALRGRHAVKKHRNPENRRTVSADQYASYFKFSIVRNPWGRAYSWYRNCLRDPQRYRFDRNTSLSDFLDRSVCRGALRRQTSWLEDFSGRIAVDRVMRFESLEEDFLKVCDELHIAPISLPHARQGSGENYRDRFDQRSQGIIEQAYRKEIELFGYAFEG